MKFIELEDGVESVDRVAVSGDYSIVKSPWTYQAYFAPPKKQSKRLGVFTSIHDAIAACIRHSKGIK